MILVADHTINNIKQFPLMLNLHRWRRTCHSTCTTNPAVIKTKRITFRQNSLRTEQNKDNYSIDICGIVHLEKWKECSTITPASQC